jgi:hypothetical protein
VPMQETIQIIVSGSEKIFITQCMHQIDEEMTQKAVKDIDHLDLVLAKVPTKALYKLQVSVAHEIQSRAHADVTELQITKYIRDTLNINLNEVQVEKDEAKKCIGKIDHCI